MNLKDAAEGPLKESLKEQERQSALQVLEKGLQSIQPELRAAYLRLQLRNPLLIPGLLKNYSSDYLAEYCAEIFVPPASPEEAKIQLLADLVISLQYPEKKLNVIISKARLEIKKAYNAVMRDGGGWSSYESNPKKRRTALMEWYRRNQARLSYLKEIHLEDPALYEDGGGQEKRNFITRLMIKTVKDKADEELTFQKVDTHLKKLKKLKRHPPLRLEDL